MAEQDDLKGKVAIVTGAGGGMGLAIARRLAASGTRLLVNDLSLESAERTVADLEQRGHEAVATAGDVSSIEDVKRMVDLAQERFGAIHVLVNNAGVLRPTRVAEIEEEEWGPHHQGQPEGHLSLLPGRPARDAGAGLGQDHQHVVYRGQKHQHGGRCPLHCVKGGRARLHASPRARDGA